MDLLSGLNLPPSLDDKLLALMIYPEREAGLLAQGHGRRYADVNQTGGSVFALDRMHITLGDFVLKGSIASLVEKISRAVARLKIAPFEVSFDQIGGFTDDVVLQGAGVESLKSFQADLCRALAWEKLDKGFRRFTPHMTVIYGRPGGVVMPIEPVRWIVRDFVLLISHQGEGRHETLVRFPLIG